LRKAIWAGMYWHAVADVSTEGAIVCIPVKDEDGERCGLGLGYPMREAEKMAAFAGNICAAWPA